MRMRGKIISMTAVVVLLGGGLAYYFAGHKTAPGQPPLTELNAASLTELRADFNAALGQQRMILLLSPT